MLVFVELDGRFFVEQLGSFGGSPFGVQSADGAVSSLWERISNVYPYSLQEAKVTAGMEGPQAVLAWKASKKPIARLMIRRKLREFPKDPSDGILVLDESTNPNGITSISDCAPANLMRLLAETVQEALPWENAASPLVPEASMISFFLNQAANPVAAQTALAEFFAAYEARFQVQLPEDIKAGDTPLMQVLLEVQNHDFLQGPQTSSSNWWYYRIFVQPDLVDIKDQFGGDGTQNLEKITFDAGTTTLTLGSKIMDVQPFKTLHIYIENNTDAQVSLECHTLPVRTAAQPRLTAPLAGTTAGVVTNGAVVVNARSQGAIRLTDMSYKNLVVLATLTDADGELGNDNVKVHFVVNRLIHWQSNSYMSLPCLTYKTGRHQNLAWNQFHLPSFYVGMDESPESPPKQTLQYDEISRLNAKEQINLYEEQKEKGPLYRFLKLFTLELDRSHHYLRAMIEFNADIYEAPREVLAHIAYELGWEVDLDRPLIDVRLELMRLAGLYKAKGTTRLYEAMSAQQTRVFPRVQEGPGIVARAADPSLFNER